MTNAPEQQAPAPSGPIAYVSAELRVHEDGTVSIWVTGCLVKSDSTLTPVSADGGYQFDVGVNISYGMGNSELTTGVKNALASSWGITGLADVKFIPSF